MAAKKAAKKAVGKKVAKKTAPAPATPKSTSKGPVQKVVLDYVTDTQNYARFNVPEGALGYTGSRSNCVGTIYAPHGTTKVVIAVQGPAEPDESEEDIDDEEL